MRQSLLSLLRLLVENITELTLEDHWLHGQVEVVRDIIGKPLSQRALDDAERRLKEVLFKQSQLKASLFEAKEAIKQMLAGFVDHLADFAEVTSGYHDKIEGYAEEISSAKDISELGGVLDAVMRETRAVRSTPNAPAMNSATRRQRSRNPRRESRNSNRNLKPPATSSATTS